MWSGCEPSLLHVSLRTRLRHAALGREEAGGDRSELCVVELDVVDRESAGFQNDTRLIPIPTDSALMFQLLLLLLLLFAGGIQGLAAIAALYDTPPSLLLRLKCAVGGALLFAYLGEGPLSAAPVPILLACVGYMSALTWVLLIFRKVLIPLPGDRSSHRSDTEKDVGDGAAFTYGLYYGAQAAFAGFLAGCVYICANTWLAPSFMSRH